MPVDSRALILDVAGQEIMTADKVTLRLNALVTYRVADARLAVSVVDDARQALYRETQPVLRALVRRAATGSECAGKKIVKVAPWPGSLETSSHPSCCLTMP